MTYDSEPETREHVAEVRARLAKVSSELLWRGVRHDASKLEEPEKSGFDEFTPALRESSYNSPEYKAHLEAMKPFLDHHYAANSHHPEHTEQGYAGMSLLDLIEMLCDWDAATKRHPDGDLRSSIEINQGRFGYGDDLKAILLKTAEDLGFISSGNDGYRRLRATGGRW